MTNTPTQTTEQSLLSWSAPIHHAHQRTKRWYIISSVIVLSIATYGVLSGAWSVALVTIMIGAMYFLLRDHTFPNASFDITQTGVRLNETFLPWENAQGFWLLRAPDYTELHIVPKATNKSDIVIQTGTMDSAKVRETLTAFIPELTEKRERLIDLFIRICKL